MRLDKPDVDRARHRLLASPYLQFELGEDALHVELDGVYAVGESLGYPEISQSLSLILSHLPSGETCDMPTAATSKVVRKSSSLRRSSS